MRIQNLSILVGALLLSAAATRAFEPLPSTAVLQRQYGESIQPLLNNYCVRCHGATEANADLRIDTLGSELSSANVHVWTRVKNVLDVGEMPPKKQTLRPTREEQEKILNWIGSALKRFEADNLDTSGDTLIRRVNRRAYANMMQTLLGVPAQGLEEFPADGMVHGFDTVGSGLYTNSYLYDLYWRCAQRTLDLAIATTPAAPEPKTFTVKYGALYKGRQAGGATNIDRAIKDLLEDPDKFVRIDMFAGGGSAGGLDYHRLVGAHYKKKNLDEVKAAGIDWARDPACRDEIIAKLKEVQAQFRANAENLDPDFQAVGEDLSVNAPVAGVYSITARLCLSNPKYPLPVRVIATHSTGVNDFSADFMVYGSREKPDVFEFKTFLRKGSYRLQLKGDVADSYIKELYGVSPTPTWAKLVFKDGWVGLNFQLGVSIEEQKRKQPTWMFVEGEEFTVRGPLNETWPPPATTRIFPRGIKAPPSREYAEEIVLTFMKRAYGGECDADTARPYVDLVMRHFEARKNFVQAVKYGLAAVLSSPRFLYLDEEQRSDAALRRPLKAIELARRLAYFLWSDLPDDALSASASSGALLEHQELTAQIHRMLNDERSRAFKEGFTTQWLKIDKLNRIGVSGELFPGFDNCLVDSAAEESVAFFSELLEKDLSILNFVDSRFAMINGRLALHYGIPNVTGNEFRRVELPPEAHRGGVLTQASVLLANSNGMVSSPVRRGVFILDRLLGMPPGAPPPNVPAIDQVPSKAPDGSRLTQIERLSMHRANVSCARCHDKIDPLGAGLEHFNALGAWNDKVMLLISDAPKGKPKWELHAADVHGSLPDGTAFNGIDEMKQRILQHKEQFERCFIEQLATYALGRSIELSDQPALDQICSSAKEGKDGLATLVEQLVQSDLFRSK